MAITSQRELHVTREKLRQLEDAAVDVVRQPKGNVHVQELTLRSLKGLINQLKEEIARFEPRAASRTTAS